MDDALAEIELLPGRHSTSSTITSSGTAFRRRAVRRACAAMDRSSRERRRSAPFLRDDLAQRPAEAGLGACSSGSRRLAEQSGRRAADVRTLAATIRRAHRLDGLGIMINGSFVFGMDDDDEDVFERTVDWAIEQGITTATFHILTPYPGTGLSPHEAERPHRDAGLGPLRHGHVVFRPDR